MSFWYTNSFESKMVKILKKFFFHSKMCVVWVLVHSLGCGGPGWPGLQGNPVGLGQVAAGTVPWAEP